MEEGGGSPTFTLESAGLGAQKSCCLGSPTCHCTWGLKSCPLGFCLGDQAEQWKAETELRRFWLLLPWLVSDRAGKEQLVSEESYHPARHSGNHSKGRKKKNLCSRL